MKIEKISENQIKCTLTRSDLASRQLKLSELAYCTDKAKGLLQDMMDQANLEFGFNADDIPLMIEAIPVSMDCIILMITKVENPDEVDTRFSSLSSLKDLYAGSSQEEGDFSYEGETDNSLAQFSELIRQAVKDNKTSRESIFSFDTLETVIDLARRAADLSLEESSLYRSAQDNRYYLYLLRSEDKTSDFSRICKIAQEFGSSEDCSYARKAYMNEHFEKIRDRDALAILAYV